ncbi:569_t:CDS:2, partial [Funneliformis geosporum]
MSDSIIPYNLVRSSINLNCITYIDTPENNHIFSIYVKKDLTISSLKEIIKEERPYLANYDIELWRVNINPDELMLNRFDVDIEKELGGEKMPVTMKISSWFPHELNEKYLHLIVELPEYRINFKSCTDMKELIPMDKVIFKEDSFELEGEIVRTDVGIQIKSIYESNIIMMDSFTEYIKRVRKLAKKIRRKMNKQNQRESCGGATMRENLMWYMRENIIIYLHLLNKRFSWLDFRAQILEQRNLQKLPQRDEQQKFHVILNDRFDELLFIGRAFKELFWSYEMSTVSAGWLNEKEVILVSMDLPEGSLLPFPLPIKFKGISLIIDYDVIIPFHRNYHEKLVPGISIGKLKFPIKNACTIGLLIRIKKRSEENFKGFYILTTKHGLGKRGSVVCQPGTLDNGWKGCASITKYTCLNTDANGHLIDYAICRLSNDNRVSINPNIPFGSGINICNLEELSNIGHNSYNKNYVKKSGRTTYVTEGIMVDEWDSVKFTVFNPPRYALAIKIFSRRLGSSFGAQGDSGSPIFNENNQLLGILHGGDQNASYMVPIEIIKHHLRTHYKVEIELIG